MKGHLLQSKQWENYEKLEEKTTFRETGKLFDSLSILNHTPLGNYLFLPYGPTLNEKNPEKSLNEALKSLLRLAKKNNAYAIRIEPTTPLTASKIAKIAKELGYSSKKSHDLDPHYTWVLDLIPEEDKLLAGIEKTKVRNWKNRKNKNITIRKTKDPEEIGILMKFLAEISEKDNFTPQTESHLKNQLKSGFSTLYICEVEEKENPEDNNSPLKTVPIGASLVYDYKDIRYYAHAATDNEHRKLRAGNILLVEMILDAKNEGRKCFDFWGITKSEDPKHPWYGFTQYKKSFGGYEVEYSGTYDIILNPVKYRLYELLRKANRMARKIKP